MYIRLDTLRDGIHPFHIVRSWKEVSGHVDAVFSYGDKIYIIQVKWNIVFHFQLKIKSIVSKNVRFYSVQQF